MAYNTDQDVQVTQSINLGKAAAYEWSSLPPPPHTHKHKSETSTTVADGEEEIVELSKTNEDEILVDPEFISSIT